ncbi:granulocyte-macrophage colony-stimulating factor receptor subunit alpha isoform X7 [Rattus norvegicus]|uniref:granulocyte-macrophage colony-stimulating factor receptor subunit alpha isoform X7 n=1 Tax=Rattus norvegicus TaxID=10116 RepID=UPI002FD8591C
MSIIPLPQLLALLCCCGLAAATQGPTDPSTPPNLGLAHFHNLTFDPGTWTLSWACGGHDGAVMSCTVIDQEAGIRRRVRSRGCRCRFQPMELHRGVDLEVAGDKGHAQVHQTLRFENEGAPGSGAENLTCEILAAHFLCCYWAVGPAAPDDIRYSLRVLNATGHEVASCSAAPGTPPTRCQADDLTHLPRLAYIVVTGQSRTGLVRFLDAVVNTKGIERLGPPDNVSASCNFSHCTITWAPPPTWAPMTEQDFRFEIEWKKAEPSSIAQKARRPQPRRGPWCWRRRAVQPCCVRWHWGRPAGDSRSHAASSPPSPGSGTAYLMTSVSTRRSEVMEGGGLGGQRFSSP